MCLIKVNSEIERWTAHQADARVNLVLASKPPNG